MNDSPIAAVNPPPMPAGMAAPETHGPIAALLKNPRRIADSIANRDGLLAAALALLAAGALCHAVFGLAVGWFGGWPVAAMDAAKMPLVGLCSLLLCFPSLYVFSCVAGTPLSLSQALVLGCSCFAMVGLILVALAPVAWLFAVSTTSLSFVAMLAFLLWLVAIGFAARFVEKLKANALFQRQTGIKLWFFILMLVTLQMATCMRPMLSQSDDGWWTSKKQFFLAHFVATLEAED